MKVDEPLKVFISYSHKGKKKKREKNRILEFHLIAFQ